MDHSAHTMAVLPDDLSESLTTGHCASKLMGACCPVVSLPVSHVQFITAHLIDYAKAYPAFPEGINLNNPKRPPKA